MSWDRVERSHPDYEQLITYISKDIAQAAKIALLTEGEEWEFSELVSPRVVRAMAESV